MTTGEIGVECMMCVGHAREGGGQVVEIGRGEAREKQGASNGRLY